MSRFRELPIALAKGLSPGREFGCVWDSVGPPLLPSDVGEKLETYLDTFIAELATQLPSGSQIERDETPNEFRLFITSPRMQGTRSGLAINFDRLGPGLVIYLRRFVPASKCALFLPWGSWPSRATTARAAISDKLQQAAVAALEATFPKAGPFTWRNDASVPAAARPLVTKRFEE